MSNTNQLIVTFNFHLISHKINSIITVVQCLLYNFISFLSDFKLKHLLQTYIPPPPKKKRYKKGLNFPPTFWKTEQSNQNLGIYELLGLNLCHKYFRNC